MNTFVYIQISGSEFVEPAPLEVCIKMVVDSKKERRQKEQLEREKTAGLEAIKKVKSEKKVRIQTPDGHMDG